MPVRVTKFYREVLRGGTPSVRVSTFYRETLRSIQNAFVEGLAAPVSLTEAVGVVKATSVALAEEPSWSEAVVEVYTPFFTITLISPTNGATITKTTPIVIDVQGTGQVFFKASYAGQTSWECAFDGAAFSPSFQGATNTQEPISGGYRYTFLRDGGWPGTPTLEVYRVDEEPAVAFDAAASAPVHKAAPLRFDVTDVNLLNRVIVVASYAGLAPWEIVHDGERFSPRFSQRVNTREAIAEGFRYTILRNGGWPGAPTITVYADEEV